MLQTTVLDRYTSYGGPNVVLYHENNTTEPYVLDRVVRGLKTLGGTLLTEDRILSRFILCAKCRRVLDQRPSYCEVSMQ